MTNLKQRKDRLEKKMGKAPFQRMLDKCLYVFGVNFFILFAYFIAKFPHDYVYTYTVVMMLGLMIHRYITF